MIKCEECSVMFHGHCLLNFTHDMKNMMFLCPKCKLTNFMKQSYACNKCNKFITERKHHLERHQINCGKFSCANCKMVFNNKKN